MSSTSLTTSTSQTITFSCREENSSVSAYQAKFIYYYEGKREKEHDPFPTTTLDTPSFVCRYGEYQGTPPNCPPEMCVDYSCLICKINMPSQDPQESNLFLAQE